MAGAASFTSPATTAQFHNIAVPGEKHVQKHFIISRKLSGLEEAMRIKRSRELQYSRERIKRSPLRCGNVSERLPVPEHIPRPPYLSSDQLPEISNETQVHGDEGIACMRAACALATRVLNYAGSLVQVFFRQAPPLYLAYDAHALFQPLRTTDEIDEKIHKMIIDAGAYPSPLGYGSFPKSICTSVNECMFHGIPDSRPLQDGDIINIDVTVYLNGYHGDTSMTFLCGNVDESAKHLVKVTEECLERAITMCKDGAPFMNISKKIRECAEQYGYGVDSFIGHGVGRIFHSAPTIWHESADELGCMVEGQTFTIEPILTMGSTECIRWNDGWTTVTADGSLASQFEHTLLITRTGAEVLTKLEI